MSRSLVIASSGRLERGDRSPWPLVQPVAAGAALLVLVWGLIDGFWPTWPMWTLIAILGLGFLVGPLGRLAPGRPAQPLAAFACLLVVSFGLPDRHPHWPVSPLWLVVLVLGLGLAAHPIVRLLAARPTAEAVLPVVALAAILVLLWSLSTDGFWFYTLSPTALHSVDELPVATLRVVIGLLGLVLLAAAARGRPTAPRSLLLRGGVLAALFILVLTVAIPPSHGLRPEWPLWWAIAILLVGLLVEPVDRLLGLPGASVLAARVDELSRTRRGVLDVQATELRRIERDLHDGAQVRLVALSLKLGRAEDRYRDDPETAALLREAREDALAAIRELRELARGIAPPVLANRGLEVAVRSLAHRSGTEASVRTQLGRRPPPAVETAAYFVVAESLANAAKHAPGARVEIALEEPGDDLLVQITDFGAGGADPLGGGLTGLRQRVEALDGVLHVTSPAGVGTQVEAVLPCAR